jgi:hypothetical protein
MLNKALDEVDASRVAITALQSENAALKRLQEADDALINAKDKMIELQDKRYDRLAATKCSTKSYFWVIRSKTCF